MGKAQTLKKARKELGITRREMDRIARAAHDALDKDLPKRQPFHWLDRQGVTSTSGTPHNKSREMERRLRQKAST